MIHRRVISDASSVYGTGDFVNDRGLSVSRYARELGGRASQAAPQAYKDVSADRRTGLSSFFAYGKRAAERDAYQQAHMTPSGVPGVLNLAVVNPQGIPIPYAPFNWNGRQMYTDAKGQIKYVEKDYFQTAISLENERVKYVTQMISLVAGQPSENVIALFGYDFYDALAGDPEGATGGQAAKAQTVYYSYLKQAGLDLDVIRRKARLFKNYSDAECSPEVMCNFGDNDPEWSRAFNKLSLLIEYHPSAILFDQGTLNPTESAGRVHGDSGHSNAGPMDRLATGIRGDATTGDLAGLRTQFPDSNTVRATDRGAVETVIGA